MGHPSCCLITLPGCFWSGLVQFGLVSSVLVWSGLQLTGLVGFSLVWSGMDWIGLAWSVLVWFDWAYSVWSGLIGLVWFGLVWSDLFWSCLVWFDLVFSGWVWCDLVWLSSPPHSPSLLCPLCYLVSRSFKHEGIWNMAHFINPGTLLYRHYLCTLPFPWYTLATPLTLLVQIQAILLNDSPTFRGM